MTGPADLAHRFATPSVSGPDDGLLEATVLALKFITATRKTRLERHLASYVESLSKRRKKTPVSRKPQLQIEVRTSSRSLAAVGPELSELVRGIASSGLLKELAVQLDRFPNIKWVALDEDAAELSSLKLWSELYCTPGSPFLRDCNNMKLRQGPRNKNYSHDRHDLSNASDSGEQQSRAA